MLITIIGIIFAIFGGIIVVVHLTLYVGLFRAGARAMRNSGGTGERLTVTIIVPARNEENLLPGLIRTLENQTRTDFLVRLIDDRSSDKTPEIASEYASRHPGKVSIITLTEEPKIENPKLNALAEGTRDLTSDILLFTDADCRVPDTWVEELSKRFEDPTIGLIIAPIETRRGASFLSQYHAFEHVFKAAYNAACVGIGMPTGGFGNNLALRRSSLVEIGGFEAVDATATEDAALIARIRTYTEWKVQAQFSRSVTVITEKVFTILLAER